MTAPEGISLEKAIKVLKDPKSPEWDRIKAEDLGIEALKRIANIRRVGNIMPGSLLPGETEK